MILAEVRQYLTQHKRVALNDLSHHFGSDPEALRGMLAVLERKGKVRRMPMGTPCWGGCCKCDPARVEIFEWIERAQG
jgi:hypothetical protein